MTRTLVGTPDPDDLRRPPAIHVQYFGTSGISWTQPLTAAATAALTATTTCTCAWPLTGSTAGRVEGCG